MIYDPKFTYEVTDMHGRKSTHYAEATGAVKDLTEIRKLLVHKFGEECTISKLTAVTCRGGAALNPQPSEFAQ